MTLPTPASTAPTLTKRSGYPASARARSRAGIAVLLLVSLLVLTLSGCWSRQDAGAGEVTPDTPLSDDHPAPDLTPWSFGSQEPAAIDVSVLVVQERDERRSVTGSAVVVNRDGYLLTDLAVVAGDVEIQLPDGRTARPVLVAVEPNTGLALVKIPARELTPIRFTTRRLDAGDSVYAAGFDGSPESFGQIGGSVTATDTLEPMSSDFHVRGPTWIQTNIPLVPGFRGAALSDDAGAFSGLIVPAESDDGHQVAAAVSSWYASAWLEHWRDTTGRMGSAAQDWPVLEMPDGWLLRYPEGWTLSVQSGDADSFRAELAPGDPDAVLRLSVSTEELDFVGDAQAFAEEHFADRRGATIWGTLTVAERPAVRVLVEQEGALLDIVYVLDGDRLVTFSLTSGYLPGDARAQAEQAYKLFEVVVRCAIVVDR
jgi:hypothetical protein